MNYNNKGKRDILIFPQFSNIQEIQKIRKQYDELYDIILPHITLAFPFNINMSNYDLKEKLKETVESIKPFKIKAKGISIKKDNKINKYYIFLNITEGNEVIKELNHRIYNSILTNIKIGKYIPHITLGTTDNINEIIELDSEFETIVDNIVVERIGPKEESIIEFKIDL